MDLVASHELADVVTEPIIGVRRNVMKLVDRDQPVVKRLDAEPLHGEAQRRVRTDEDLIRAGEKSLNGVHFAAVVAPWGIAEIPPRYHGPVGKEAVGRQSFVSKARADRLFRHDHDCLPEPLVGQLVEGHEH